MRIDIQHKPILPDLILHGLAKCYVLVRTVRPRPHQLSDPAAGVREIEKVKGACKSHLIDLLRSSRVQGIWFQISCTSMGFGTQVWSLGLGFRAKGSASVLLLARQLDDVGLGCVGNLPTASFSCMKPRWIRRSDRMLSVAMICSQLMAFQ